MGKSELNQTEIDTLLEIDERQEREGAAPVGPMLRQVNVSVEPQRLMAGSGGERVAFRLAAQILKRALTGKVVVDAERYQQLLEIVRSHVDLMDVPPEHEVLVREIHGFDHPTPNEGDREE